MIQVKNPQFGMMFVINPSQKTKGKQWVLSECAENGSSDSRRHSRVVVENDRIVFLKTENNQNIYYVPQKKKYVVAPAVTAFKLFVCVDDDDIESRDFGFHIDQLEEGEEREED
jgi:hypothetical protein